MSEDLDFDLEFEDEVEEVKTESIEDDFSFDDEDDIPVAEAKPVIKEKKTKKVKKEKVVKTSKTTEIKLDNSFPIQKIELDEKYKARLQQNFNDEELVELGKDIKERGQACPLSIYEDVDSKFYLMAGFRRRVAMEKSGLKKARVEIFHHSKFSVEKAKAISLGSNLYRKDLSPWELVSDLYQMSQQGIPATGKGSLTKIYNISKTKVYAWIATATAAEKWPELKEALSENKLNISQADALIEAKTNNNVDVLGQTLLEGLTANQIKIFGKGKVEKDMDDAIAGEIEDGSTDPTVEEAISEIEDEVEDTLMDELEEDFSNLDDVEIDNNKSPKGKTVAQGFPEIVGLYEVLTNAMDKLAKGKPVTKQEFSKLTMVQTKLSKTYRRVETNFNSGK